jgi:molecular chaperone DnaK
LARIIGIDLGTTNSCVAALERVGPTVLASREGERTIPSVVAFLPSGRVVVGVPAKRQAVTNAGSTIYAAKRLIGRKVNAPDVERFARTAPFAIVTASNGDAWVRLPTGRDVSPQEVSAYVLERMRDIAQQALGEPVTQAVITVPAYFNDAQRQATKDAGRIAGLDVRRILNEPTAAALAYGVHRRKTRQRLAVFDLGGGTFDVSILTVDRGVFEVLAVNGNASLGGDDFDRRVVEMLVAELEEDGGVGVATDPVALGRLKEEAERAKKILSDEPSATLHLPFIGKTAAGGPLHLERTLTRNEFEATTRDLVDRLAEPCAQALADAGIPVGGLDDVLLVGGMTRVPAVIRAVEQIFGRRPSKGANPDEVVALGAAAHGGILTGEVREVVLLDVIPHSLGVRVGETVSTVIPKNTTVPARVAKLFATSKADQDFVSIEVYQGESKEAKENRHLGKFTLEGLPSGPAGSVRVEVSFTVDADGILSVGAREQSTGRAATLTITPSSGLSDDELTKIVEERRRLRAVADTLEL